jgi:hypothetical protein
MKTEDKPKVEEKIAVAGTLKDTYMDDDVSFKTKIEDLFTSPSFTPRVAKSLI